VWQNVSCNLKTHLNLPKADKIKNLFLQNALVEHNEAVRLGVLSNYKLRSDLDEISREAALIRDAPRNVSLAV